MELAAATHGAFVYPATPYPSRNGALQTATPSKQSGGATTQASKAELQNQSLQYEGGLSVYDPPPSFYTLSSQLDSLCHVGQLDMAMEVLSRMDQLGFSPSNKIYWSLLHACKKKKSHPHASQLCSLMQTVVLDPSNCVISEYLISTLISCDAFNLALQVFHDLPVKTVYSWTALITGYVNSGNAHEALRLYELMLKNDVQPDKYTCVSLLKACTSTLNLEMGRAIHERARENSYESDAFIGTALTTMYSKCGSIVDAEDVFGMMPHRNVAAWTTMLAGYVENGQAVKALQLYRQMQEDCLVFDEQTFAVALQACCILADKEKTRVRIDRGVCKVRSLDIVQAIHANARRKGFDSNVYIGNLLVLLYGKCGNMVAADYVFTGFQKRNFALWNAMLSAYVEGSRPERALQLYKLMLEHGQSPQERSFVLALQACSLLTEKEDPGVNPIKIQSLAIGEALHEDARKRTFETALYVSSALVNMYGKCGSPIKAKDVFDGLPQRSIVSWNAMLSAYIEQAQLNQALQLYQKMQDQRTGSDDVTFICLLKVAGQTGSIELCRMTHNDIVMAGFDLKPLVAFNLIYALGDCASMVDAQAVFDLLPVSNLVPWNALLAGYAQKGNFKKCLYLFRKLQQVGLKPNSETFSSMLVACNCSSLVGEGIKIFDSMSPDHGVTPELGHYAIMVTLLGYAGELVKLEDLLSRMPMEPTLSVWVHILKACLKHGNVRFGKRAFDCALQLQPKEAAPYLLMSKLYSGLGLQDQANEVEMSRQREGACQGIETSWIEHEGDLLSFPCRSLDSVQEVQNHGHLWELGRSLREEEDLVGLEYLFEEKIEPCLCRHSQNVALAFTLHNSPLTRHTQVKKNSYLCQECHELIKLISRARHVHIVLIDDERVHHFKGGKCSCRDYFYTPSKSTNILST